MQDPTNDPSRLGDLIDRFDWSSTPLGAIESWAQSLRTAVYIMLGSGHAMQLAWGPERTVLYNDAYAPMLGARHPGALGLPFPEAWPDVWNEIEPLVQRVFAGETVRFEEMPLILTRHGYPEETWWNFSYSPVRDETGAVAGLLNVTVDASPRVRAERAERERDKANALLRKSELRQTFLLALSDALRPLYDPAEIQGEATRLLREQLDVGWCYYNEFDGTGIAATVLRDSVKPGLHTMVGVHDLSDVPQFLGHIRSGRLFNVPDLARSPLFNERVVERYTGIRMHSVLGVPLVKQDRLIAVLVVADTKQRVWSGDEIALLTDVAERTWAAVEQARAESALQESEQRLRQLIAGIPQLVWRAADSGSWTWASRQWAEYTGQREVDSRGWGWIEAVHSDDRALAREAFGHAIQQGGFEVEYRIRNSVDDDYRWFQTRATPVRNESGVIIEWLGTSTDIHDLRELQERQQVLVAELQHRTRNLISVVRSMADKTARTSGDLLEFRGRFRDRLDALARVQGLLSRLNERDRVTFDQLIDTEVAAMDGSYEKVSLSGPGGVRLRSSTVQTLAMALHELGTNAMKYGALSQPDGRLAVTWSLERAGAGGKPWLHIDWRESGVEMQAPYGSGQGRELIEQALPYQLSAETSYSLEADGVHCTISIPVSAGNTDTQDV